MVTLERSLEERIAGFVSWLRLHFGEILSAVEELRGLQSHIVFRLRSGEQMVIGAEAVKTGDAPLAKKRFDLASITKAAVFMTLFRILQRYGIDVTECIQNYLPEFRGNHADKVTFLDLAAYRFWLNLPTDFNQLSAIDMERAMLSSDLREPPGKHIYSNPPAFIAGKLVERISGKLLAAAMSEYVLVPLGLTDLGFSTLGVDTVSTGGKPGVVHDPTARAFSPKSIGVAGMFGTSESVARLFASVVEPGFLTDEMRTLIFTNHAAVSGRNFGMGFDMQGPNWWSEEHQYLVEHFRFVTGHTKNSGMVVSPHMGYGNTRVPGFGASLMVALRDDPNVISANTPDMVWKLNQIKNFRRRVVIKTIELLEDAIRGGVLVH